MFRVEVPVKEPFDLRLTARALQRLGNNAVDVISADGTYRRALQDRGHTIAVRVRQIAPQELDVAFAGARTARLLPTIERMFAIDLRLRSWETRVASIPWLRDLARAHRGLRPPRYPTLWEAVAHAIVFQQISLHAAAAIMYRFVRALATPIEDERIVLFPFPDVRAVVEAPMNQLQHAGLSANKARALKEAANAFAERKINEATLQRLPSAEAIAALSRLRGIGPWSATVILLRGLGRLDVFPLNDTGVAATIKVLSGSATVDLDELLLRLGDQRGMLYFHLLIGRLAHAERLKK